MEDKIYVDGHAVMGLHIEDIPVEELIGERGRITVQADVTEVKRLNELFVVAEHIVTDGWVTYTCAVREMAKLYGEDENFGSFVGTKRDTLDVRVLDVKEDDGAIMLQVKHFSREGTTLWVYADRFVEWMTPRGAVLRKDYLQTDAGKKRLRDLQVLPKQAAERLKEIMPEGYNSYGNN